jgi:hypothetical protein
MGGASLHEAPVIVGGDLGLAADRDVLLCLFAAGLTLGHEIFSRFYHTGDSKQGRTEYQGGKFHG